MTRLDISLNDGWTVTSECGKHAVPATLPKYALEALADAGVVPDPLVRFGERDLRWVANTRWTFARTFDAPPVPAGAAADLVLDGVDAVATISLNGAVIATCESAFVPVVVDVTSRLRPGRNELAIAFDAAPAAASARARAYPYKVPYVAQVGALADWNFVRKAASDFGWDWGPAFAPVGVAGGVTLAVHGAARLVGATVRQAHAPDGAIEVTFGARLRRAGGRGETGRLVVTPVAGGLAPACAAAEVDVELPPSATLDDWDDVVAADVAVTVPAGAAPLWWPHGYGDQPLLAFDVAYVPAGGAAPPSTLARRVGLRTVDLVRDPAPFEGDGPPPGEPSATFCFRCNGVPIFAKGANYIPPSIFHSRAPALAAAAIRSAAAAHMNMVRVWGGGAYPPDAFFDAADEAGVLVWQEFMAACALYPRDARFLALCARETRHQAARAGAHTCLAIWGGNNELEPAFGWFPEARANARLYACDYAALFVDTVRAALLAVHPGVAFIDSSPTSGALCEAPYVKWWGNPDSWYAGDVHFYDYEADPLDPVTFPRARFVSEFGFQSHPSFDAYAKVTAPADWARDSEAVHYRQRHEGGNEEMDAQIARTFVLPPAAPPPDWCAPGDAGAALFRHWVYLTQVNQALAYETAIGLWRGLRSNPAVGTAGVLYWQLNDIWAGQSWSGLDADGGWRLLHHAARRFFAPVALWCDTRGGALAVQAASDVRWRVAGALAVDVIPWRATSAAAVTTVTADFELDAQQSAVVFRADWGDVLGAHAPTDVVVRVRARAAGAAPDAVAFPADPHRVLGGSRVAAGDDATFAAEAVAFAARPRDAVGLAVAPKLSFGDVSVDGARATFTVSSSAVALAVSLSSGSTVGTFSDSGFLLLPWEPRTVTFDAADGARVDGAALAAALAAGSLSVGDTLVWGVERAPGPKAGPPPGLEPTYDWQGLGVKTRAAE